MYAQIARALRDCQPTSHSEALYFEKMVRTLAHDFSQANPNFRKGQFFRDCGLPKKEK